jgi:hypothetical protein
MDQGGCLDAFNCHSPGDCLLDLPTQGIADEADQASPDPFAILKGLTDRLTVLRREIPRKFRDPVVATLIEPRLDRFPIIKKIHVI